MLDKLGLVATCWRLSAPRACPGCGPSVCLFCCMCTRRGHNEILSRIIEYREVVLVISSNSVIVECFHGTTASLIFSYPLGPEFPDKDCGRGNIRSAWQVLVRWGSAVTRAGNEGPWSFHNHGESLLLERLHDSNLPVFVLVTMHVCIVSNVKALN